MEFNEALEAELQTLVTSYVGVGSDPTDFVKTFDDHLRDFDLKTENPFMVVSVRQGTAAAAEIGARHGHKTYQALMYFVFVSKDWTSGKAKRNKLVNRLVKRMEANPLLNSFSFVDPDGVTEYVWSSQPVSWTFDESGQDGYYSFVSVITMTVDTSS